MNKTKIFSFSTIAIATLMSFGVSAENNHAIPVTVELAQQFHSASTIEEVGKLKATDSATLTFSAGEKLKQLNFKDGDSVKKGDLIAQLDDSQAVAELDKAKSSLALAESKLTRVLALLKKQPDSMSAQDVEELKQQVALAKAEFKQKKTDLQNYQMIAPFDGQLTNFTHSLGSRVEAATALVTLIKLDPVEVHYAISQSEVGKAKLGQPVSLTVDAYGATQFTGRVDYIAPQVDESSGRIEVHAHLDNADNKLVPGMFAKVSQGIGDSTNQVIVSQTSVGADGDQQFVWVVEEGKAVKHPVEIGQNTNNGYVAITSGLDVGEKVVITGQQNLQVESAVSVQGTKSPVTLPAKGIPSKTDEIPEKSSLQPKAQLEQASPAKETNHEAA